MGVLVSLLASAVLQPGWQSGLLHSSCKATRTSLMMFVGTRRRDEFPWRDSRVLTCARFVVVFTYVQHNIHYLGSHNHFDTLTCKQTRKYTRMTDTFCLITKMPFVFEKK